MDNIFEKINELTNPTLPAESIKVKFLDSQIDLVRLGPGSGVTTLEAHTGNYLTSFYLFLIEMYERNYSEGLKLLHRIKTEHYLEVEDYLEEQILDAIAVYREKRSVIDGTIIIEPQPLPEPDMKIVNINPRK